MSLLNFLRTETSTNSGVATDHGAQQKFCYVTVSDWLGSHPGACTHGCLPGT